MATARRWLIALSSARRTRSPPFRRGERRLRFRRRPIEFLETLEDAGEPQRLFDHRVGESFAGRFRGVGPGGENELRFSPRREAAHAAR
jgi:hypothetical protein